MHRIYDRAGSNDRNYGQQATSQYHDEKRWQDKSCAGNRSDCGKEFDVSCAHGSENVQHEHQAKSQDATAQAPIQSSYPAKYGVDRYTTYERRQNKGIGDATIAN